MQKLFLHWRRKIRTEKKKRKTSKVTGKATINLCLEAASDSREDKKWLTLILSASANIWKSLNSAMIPLVTLSSNSRKKIPSCSVKFKTRHLNWSFRVSHKTLNSISCSFLLFTSHNLLVSWGEIKWPIPRGDDERNRSSWTHLTASRSWLAMCFLLLEGVTHMALMPQIAGTASFSQTIGPLGVPSNASRLLTEGALWMTSLWKLTVPNWSLFEFGPASFELVSSDLSSAEDERIL